MNSNITELDLCMITGFTKPENFHIEDGKCYRKIGELGLQYIGSGYVNMIEENNSIIREIFFESKINVKTLSINITFKHE